MNEQSEVNYQRGKKIFIQSIEKRVIDSQSIMQKNSKIPPIKLFLMDIDEATKYLFQIPASPLKVCPI